MKSPSPIEPSMRDNLVALIEAVAKARGITIRSVCRKVANDDRFLIRVEDGGTFTARVYDQIVARCAIEMPEDGAWPKGIERPSIKKIGELLRTE